MDPTRVRTSASFTDEEEDDDDEEEESARRRNSAEGLCVCACTPTRWWASHQEAVHHTYIDPFLYYVDAPCQRRCPAPHRLLHRARDLVIRTIQPLCLPTAAQNDDLLEMWLVSVDWRMDECVTQSITTQGIDPDADTTGLGPTSLSRLSSSCCADEERESREQQCAC